MAERRLWEPKVVGSSPTTPTLKPKPFVKWAGGKTQILGRLLELIPQDFKTYYEPFLGGGALFFSLLPERAVLADRNEELINAYIVVRDRPRELIESLKKHRNEREYYYQIRSLDPSKLGPVERASRFIYLNKTCYNGLWRVNSKGEFNVPFGRYRRPNICNEENLLAVSQALKGKEILCEDFERAVASAGREDLVYFDPPYHSSSKTASFTKYVREDFPPSEQERLARIFRNLDRRGCYLILSNSDTPFIRDLYKGFRIIEVRTNRFINSKACSRKDSARELIITNF